MAAVSQITPLLPLLLAIKAVKIPYEYIHEDDGSYSCFTRAGTPGAIITHGSGATLDDAVDDYVEGLKEIASCIYEENIPDEYVSPEFLLKVLLSSREELKSCLAGTPCEDF